MWDSNCIYQNIVIEKQLCEIMDKIYSRHRIKIPNIKNKKKCGKNLKKLYFIIILYAITIITSWYILKSIDPIFEGLCSAKALSIATDIINKESSEALAKYNYKDTVQIIESEDGKNNILKTDIVTINEITSDIAIEIQDALNEIGKQYIEIPIGALTGNKYFAGFGPKVKIKIIPTGDISTDIKTEFKGVGINQTVYRIYLQIECNVSILTSYKTIEQNIKSQVLLVETVVVGEVPETYLQLENIENSEEK